MRGQTPFFTSQDLKLYGPKGWRKCRDLAQNGKMKKLFVIVFLMVALLCQGQLIEVGTFEGKVHGSQNQDVNHGKNCFMTYEYIENDSTLIRCYKRGRSNWRKTLELSFYQMDPWNFTMLNGTALIVCVHDPEDSYALYDSTGFVKYLEAEGRTWFYDFGKDYMLLHDYYAQSGRERYIGLKAFNSKTDYYVFNEPRQYVEQSLGVPRLNEYAFFFSIDPEHRLWSFTAWGSPEELVVCDDCIIVVGSASDSFVFGFTTDGRTIKSDGTIDGTVLKPFVKDVRVLDIAGSWIIYSANGPQQGMGRSLLAYNIATEERYEMIRSRANNPLPDQIFDASWGDFFFDKGRLFWKLSFWLPTTDKRYLYEWDLNIPNQATMHEWPGTFFSGQAYDGFLAMDTSVQGEVSIYDYKLGNAKWIEQFKIKGSPRYVDFYDGYQNSFFIATSAGSIYELDHAVGSGEAYPIAVDINLYPNPAKERVTITSSQELQSVILYSLSGKELLRQEHSCTSSMQLELSSLQKGMYVLSIASAGQTVSRKLTIE